MAREVGVVSERLGVAALAGCSIAIIVAMRSPDRAAVWLSCGAAATLPVAFAALASRPGGGRRTVIIVLLSIWVSLAVGIGSLALRPSGGIVEPRAVAESASSSLLVWLVLLWAVPLVIGSTAYLIGFDRHVLRRRDLEALRTRFRR